MKQAINKVEKVSRAVNSISRAPVKSLGGAIGKKLGSRRTGESIGAFIGKITGTGDYRVMSNSMGKRGFSTDAVPQFTGKTRGVRVTHREYLGDVVASSTAGAFSVTSYAIQPALFSSFPWLASFAAQFDEWRPNGIVYCYRPMSSMYSGTSSLGTVIMATDYDVVDAPYVSKIEMENSEFAVSANCASAQYHPIECKMSERMANALFTRSGGVSDSLRFYDLGNFQIATAGCTANQVCGELWVTYDITFMKPQLYGGISGGGILYSRYSLTSSTAAAPLGTSRSLTSGSTLRDLTLTSTTIAFPLSCIGGTFIVAVGWNGSGGVTYADPGFTASNGAVGVYTNNNSYAGFLTAGDSTSTAGGTAVTRAHTFFTVYLTTPPTPGTLPTLTLGTSGTIPTSLTSAYLYITQAPRYGFQ